MFNLFKMKFKYISLFIIAFLPCMAFGQNSVKVQIDPICSPILKENQAYPIFKIKVEPGENAEVREIDLNFEGFSIPGRILYSRLLIR